jgi:hypothetical protein
MKFYFKMPAKLRPYYQLELEEYNSAIDLSDLPKAWQHLERAHILGQAYPIEHSLAHWKMLQFGFKIKSWKEIRGQIIRLIFGGVKSFVGKIPTGNTGGSNVHPLLKMEIPEDLKLILKGGNG